jgi:hypothetical protein
MSAVRMTPCPSTGRAPLKKRLPTSPCGHMLSSPALVWPDAPETDTRTIDQAVGGKADPNCRVFSIGPQSVSSADTDLGGVWVGLLIG